AGGAEVVHGAYLRADRGVDEHGGRHRGCGEGVDDSGHSESIAGGGRGSGLWALGSRLWALGFGCRAGQSRQLALVLGVGGFTDAITVTASRGERTFRRVSPKVGVTAALTADAVLYGNVSTGFEAPTLGE